MKKLLLTLLALSFALMAFAQVDITIGSGTSTGRYPLNDYFKYSRSQSLYMESEIGAPGTIHKLRWYRNDTGANTAAIATTQIWLKSVTNAVLTGTDWEDPGTLVAEITDIDLGAGGGWYEVDITDFAYSGGHLLVSVYTQNAPYTSPHAYWRYTSTTGINTLRYGNSDSLNPPSLSLGTSRPNIQINMTASSPTSAPNPAAILSPTDAALNVALDASLNWSSGGGFPDGYYLSFGTVDPYTTILDGEDMEGDTSYEPQNLAYGTEYWWQVVPYNTYGNATGCPTWSFTTMADPTQPLPYLQDFNSGTSLTAIGWSGTFSIMANHGTSGSNGLSRNLYSYVPTANAVTPPIGPLAPDSEILFDYRYVLYSGYPGTAHTLGTGDQLQIQVSTDGVTFDTLHTIDMNNHVTSTSFAPVTVNVSAYSGNIFVRFNATCGTGDYYLDIDNVIVREVPLAPIISVTPDSWDFGTMLINTSASKEFTISNIGAGTLNVTTVNVTGTGFALAEAFTPVALLPLESASFTVNFSPLTATTYSGNIAINDNRAITNIPLSGEALDATIYAGDLPHTENFDGDWTGSPAAPFGWTVINANSDSYYWSQANNYISPTHSGDYAAHGMGNTNDYLITPPIDLSDTDARISWWDKVESASYANSYKVLLSTTDTQIASFTEELGDFTCLNTDWTEHFVNLSEYTDETVYIAFYQYASAATYYGFGIDDVKIDIILPQPPEPATLVWPLNGITTLMNPLLKWAPSATGEPATGYKVYLNDSGTFTEGDVVYEGTNLQYQTADLVIGETYYWQVTPINAYGVDSACPTWSFSTPGADQLAEGFEETWPPLGWDNTGSWSRSSSYVVEGTYSAYKYGSSSTQYVLSTPMLSIGATSTLQFGAAGSSTSATLEIVYSSDRTTWTQLGSAITYAAAYTFYPQVIDLSSLAGNDYYIGFRTGLSASSNYIDHIIGPDITPLAPGAPTLTAPIVDATDVSAWTTFTWTAPTTGGIPTGFDIYLDTVDGTTLYASDVSSPYTVSTPLAYNTTYYWTVVATNSAGDSDPATVRSFTTRSNPTISTFPWTEGFGTVYGDWPVANWSQLTGLYGIDTPASGTQWYQDDWLNVTTPANKAARINIFGSSMKGWLITPPIAIPATGYELKFDLGLTDYGSTNAIEFPDGQADDKFIVLIADNPMMTGATPLRTWDNDTSEYVYNEIPNTGTTVILDLDGYVGTYYVAFYGESTVSVTGEDNDLFVDNVTVRETPAFPIFSYAPDTIDFGTVTNGAQVGPQNVTITNLGGGTLNIATTDISITGPDATEFSFDDSALPAALGVGQSVQIPVYVTGVTEGAISATLTINYDSVDYDVALSANVLGEGLVAIGDGTANNSIPVNPYYGYTYSQSIFLQSEINMTDKRIEKISYYWNGAGAGTNTNGWTIYMGHTDEASFASTTSWVPVDSLTQVFSGTVAAPAVAGWVEIVLDSPFVYNNTDNLVIAVDENTPSYDGSGMYYYSTAVTGNRSLRYYNDYTNPDPATPPTGTLVSAYPNVLLQLVDLPTTPIFSITPDEEWDFGLHHINAVAQKEFTITNTGTDGLIINNIVVSGDAPFALDEPFGRSVNLNSEQTYSFTVNYSPTAEGTHTGLITITNNLGGDAPTIDLSGSAYDPVVSSFPWNENFDSIAVGEMPLDWKVVASHTDADDRGWIAAENIVANSAPNAATVYYHSTYAKDEWMMTPPIALEGSQLYNISFALKAPGWEGVPEALKVHYATEDSVSAMIANPALWDDYNLLQADYTTIVIPFTPATTGTYYFGWHAYSAADIDYIAVDDVSISIPAAIDAAVTGFNGTIAVVAGNAATYNVQVTNMGATDIPAYTVLLKDSTTQATLAQASISETLLIGLSATHELSWTPTVDGDYSVYAQVAAPGDLVTSNDSSDAMDVLVYPETMNMLYVGDPNSTTGTTLYPINMYYEDFIAETVYLASEIQATSGSLEALVYTNSFATAGTEQVQIWIQNTTAEDLSAGWLPWADYTQVFDGEVEFPAGMNYIQIPITPFNYTGGNLAIRTSVTYVDGWTNNNLWQITADPAGRVRTRYQQADNSELDHTAPTGTSTVTSFPNVYFFLDTEYMVASTAAPVAEVSQDAGVVELEWPPVPYAYSYNIYNSIDPYSFGTEPLATVYNNNYSYTPGAEVDANFYKVTSATYRDLARASYSPARAKKAAQPELQNVEKDQKIKTRERKSAVK